MKLRSTIFKKRIPFEEKVSELFLYQVRKNPVYGTYSGVLGFDGSRAPATRDIPLLPVRAFKEARITTTNKPAAITFKSSGTSAMKRSVHEIHDPELCRQSVCNGFDHFYPDNPVLWAYLPGYSDNPHSSLVWMLKTLTERDSSKLSRFLPPGCPPKPGMIDRVCKSGRPLILFGATFGLLDLVAQDALRLPEYTRVIETGGMKTHKREMERRELHKKLADGFRLPEGNIHSEYGMCELSSQAYSKQKGWFESVPWMEVTVRDPDDPRRVCKPGEEGVIGVIDLANLYSCPFLMTGDRGVADEAYRFRVLGRWNPENLRGCNFLIDRE